MRRANETDVLKLAAQLEAVAAILRKQPSCSCQETRYLDDGTLALLPACKSMTDHMLRVARQAAGPGRNPSNGRSGDIANPTLAAVIAQAKLDGSWKAHMGPDWWRESILGNTSVAVTALANLVILHNDLGRVTSTDPKDLSKNGQGVCAVCGVFCSGAHNDRLVSAMCDTDYRAWCRAGRPDRFDFIRSRRAEVVA